MIKFIFVCLLLSQFSFAAIYHSNYEARHLQVIEDALLQSCGIYSTDVLTQKSTEERHVQVDHGILDIYYTTVLETRVRIDQNFFETKKMIVESVRYDGYDQQAKEPGSYSVSSVNCNVE